MKTLNEYISEKLIINKNFKKDIICPTSFRKLRYIIGDRSKENHEYVDLRDIDVSKVPYFVDLSGFSIFGRLARSTMIVDVTGWDVSHITNIFELFAYCDGLREIRGLEDWDISNVNNMKNAFYNVPDIAIPSWYDREKWEV